MKEEYSSEEIDHLESDLEKAITELDPETHFSLDIPQIQDGFMRIDIYSPDDNSYAPDQSTVASAVNDYFSFETGWEECYSTELMYSISIYDLEKSTDDLEEILG